MPDLLARVALAKEGSDADAAHQALTVFNAVAQEHIKQVQCEKKLFIISQLS